MLPRTSDLALATRDLKLRVAGSFGVLAAFLIAITCFG